MWTLVNDNAEKAIVIINVRAMHPDRPWQQLLWVLVLGQIVEGVSFAP